MSRNQFFFSKVLIMKVNIKESMDEIVIEIFLKKKRKESVY